MRTHQFPTKRSEIFRREDLRAILEAIDMSNSHALAFGHQSEESRIFRLGFQSALLAVAKACHIEQTQPFTSAPGIERGISLDVRSTERSRLLNCDEA